MATRSETKQRKDELKAQLRQMCRDGRFLPGELAPPVRELAQQHEMSRKLVSQVMSELTEEGLFHSVPRKGTFVGALRQKETEFYLLMQIAITDGPDEVLTLLQFGFEDRIAQLGGTPLTMPLAKVTQHAKRGELPQLAGVFEPFPMLRHLLPEETWNAPPSLPMVCFEHSGRERDQADVVSFDDVSGGRQATQHLIGQGYQRIAFLGMHTTTEVPAAPDQDYYGWSRQREIGWREALENAGLWEECQALAFRCLVPNLVPPRVSVPTVAAVSSAPLIQRLLAGEAIDAVVAANDVTAMGLLNALREADVAPALWPAIVGFDNQALSSGHILSSLRLPWEEVGRAAADLLWERRHGRLQGEVQHRRIAMRLIPRLTCRADWSLTHYGVTHVDALRPIAAETPVSMGEQFASVL